MGYCAGPAPDISQEFWEDYMKQLPLEQRKHCEKIKIKNNESLSLQEENRKLKAENARLKKPVKKSNKH